MRRGVIQNPVKMPAMDWELALGGHRMKHRGWRFRTALVQWLARVFRWRLEQNSHEALQEKYSRDGLSPLPLYLVELVTLVFDRQVRLEQCASRTPCLETRARISQPDALISSGSKDGIGDADLGSEGSGIIQKIPAYCLSVEEEEEKKGERAALLLSLMGSAYGVYLIKTFRGREETAKQPRVISALSAEVYAAALPVEVPLALHRASSSIIGPIRASGRISILSELDLRRLPGCLGRLFL